MVRLGQGSSPTQLYSAVVDPGSNFCYFNCSGDRQDNNKRALLRGFNGWTFYSFTQTVFFGFFFLFF
jgi:hypothetical protein